MHDEERTFGLSCYAKARNDMVHIGFPAMKKLYKTIKILFQDGLCLKARMQFPSWILQWLTT